MTLADFITACDALRTDAEREVQAATTLEEWTEVRNQLVGRKSGRLTQLMAYVPTLASDERRAAGQAVNALKEAVDDLLNDRQAALTTDVLPRARMVIEPAVAGYASGQLPLVSVIEAVQALWQVQSDLIAADTELGLAWARLGRAIGSYEAIIQ